MATSCPEAQAVPRPQPSEHGPTSSPEALVMRATALHEQIFGAGQLARLGSPSLTTDPMYAQMVLGLPFRLSSSPFTAAAKLRGQARCGVFDQLLPSHTDQLAGKTDEEIAVLATELSDKRSNYVATQVLGCTDPHSLPKIWLPFNVTFGFNTKIGPSFFGNANLRVHDHAFVIIGSEVWIGPNVSLLTEGHDVDVGKRNEGSVVAQSIEIGDNVWIGANVVVLGGGKDGVKIGDGTVVAAGTVVTKSVEPGVLVAGVPARVVRRLTGWKRE